jgi:hypothetical protein
MSRDAYKNLIKYCKSKGLHSRKSSVFYLITLGWFIALFVLFSTPNDEYIILKVLLVALTSIAIFVLMDRAEVAEQSFCRTILPQCLLDEVSHVNSRVTSYRDLCKNSLLKAFMCRSIVSDQICSSADIIKITMLFNSTDLTKLLKQKELNTCPIGKITPVDDAGPNIVG